MRDVSHIKNEYLRQLIEARAKDYEDTHERSRLGHIASEKSAVETASACEQVCNDLSLDFTRIDHDPQYDYNKVGETIFTITAPIETKISIEPWYSIDGGVVITTPPAGPTGGSEEFDTLKASILRCWLSVYR